jgi:hypothetical protein
MAVINAEQAGALRFRVIVIKGMRSHNIIKIFGAGGSDDIGDMGWLRIDV